jgi:hypothetical protein
VKSFKVQKPPKKGGEKLEDHPENCQAIIIKEE